MTDALTPVLADLFVQTGVVPEVRHSDWPGPNRLGADIYFRGAGGVGVSVTDADAHSHQVVSLADQIQDWAVEALWAVGRSPVWPVCPDHPDSHPMKAVGFGGVADWVCPVSLRVIAEIGTLTG